jgi:hypothetical protein
MQIQGLKFKLSIVYLIKKYILNTFPSFSIFHFMLPLPLIAAAAAAASTSLCRSSGDLNLNSVEPLYSTHICIALPPEQTSPSGNGHDRED